MNFEDAVKKLGLGLTVVAIITLLAVYLFQGIVGALASLNSDIAKAIIVASIAATGTTVTAVLGKIYQQKLTIQQEIRDKKIPLYEEQLGLFFRVFFADKIQRKAATEQELIETFAKFSEKLIIWGGPDVIRAWSNLRLKFINGEPGSIQQILALEDFMFALRKDIGNDNAILDRGDLLRLFVNDLDMHSTLIDANDQTTPKNNKAA